MSRRRNLKCFFEGVHCEGKVQPARGADGVAWLNGVVAHEEGYCDAHRANEHDARWDMSSLRSVKDRQR
jgi:hypothetical protein